MGLHLAVTFAFWWPDWKSMEHADSRAEATIHREQIVVSLNDLPKAKPGPRSRTGSKNSSKSQSKNGREQKFHSLQNVFSLVRPLSESSLQIGDGQESLSSSGGGRAVGGYGDGESLQGVLLRNRPLEVLADRILNHISYPQVLIDHKIEGKVSVELEVTPDLQLADWKKPIGANSTLNAFVLVQLLDLFRALEPQGKVSRGHAGIESKDRIKIRLNFEFQTQFIYPGISHKSHEIVDPLLSFHFVSYREPNALRWMNEHVPLVPVPGGVIINVVAAIKMIEDRDKVSPELRREQLFQGFQEGVLEKAESAARPDSLLNGSTANASSNATLNGVNPQRSTVSGSSREESTSRE
jgi:hypothetical protein